MKPSWQPPFWMLFGAGGMVAALIGTALVIVTGLAAPLRLGPLDHAMTYANALAVARNPLGKAFIFGVVALFLWHAAHRLYHTLHDFGARGGALAWLGCYGGALAGSLVAAAALLAIGW